MRLFLDFLKSVFQILEFLAHCLEAGGEFGLPLDGIAVVAELLPGAGEGQAAFLDEMVYLADGLDVFLAVEADMME